MLTLKIIKILRFSFLKGKHHEMLYLNFLLFTEVNTSVEDIINLEKHYVKGSLPTPSTVLLKAEVT